MSSSLLLAECLSTPWALMPERLQTLISVVSRWTASVPASGSVLTEVHSERVAREARRQARLAQSAPGVAILPLYGVIVQRGNLIEEVSGAGMTSTQAFSSALHAAVSDESIEQILIDIDSPGGSVYGVAELAEDIYRARASKRIVAIANSLAASAAYWIGSAAKEFYVTPGGEVGSIGVWQAHQDFSRAFEQAGISTTLISAGRYKIEGHPYAALDAEARDFMQSRVDEYYAAFVKAVARGRASSVSLVREGMGEGRVLGAEAARAANMVDGVLSFDRLVQEMVRDARRTAKARPQLAKARRELEWLAL